MKVEELLSSPERIEIIINTPLDWFDESDPVEYGADELSRWVHRLVMEEVDDDWNPLWDYPVVCEFLSRWFNCPVTWELRPYEC